MTQLANIILITISVAIFIWYRQLVIKRFGIQKSYSHSYKLFPKGIQESYYTIFMWGISIPIMIVGNCTLAWIAGALLCIDGVARTGSGDPLTQFLHDKGAQFGIAVGMAMLISFSWWFLIPVMLYGIFVLVAMKWIRNGTWWTEEVAFEIIIIGLIIEKVIL